MCSEAEACLGTLKGKRCSERKWRKVRGGESGREERVKGVYGEMLVVDSKVRGRWAEYFKELLSVEDEKEAVIVVVDEEIDRVYN